MGLASRLLRRDDQAAPGAGDRSLRPASYDAASMYLRLLVAMAAADDELRTPEIELLISYVDATEVADEERARLQELLKILLDAPPQLDQVLAELAQYPGKTELGDMLFADLHQMAGADEVFDEREGELMRSVRAALAP